MSSSGGNWDGACMKQTIRASPCCDEMTSFIKESPTDSTYIYTYSAGGDHRVYSAHSGYRSIFKFFLCECLVDIFAFLPDILK